MLIENRVVALQHTVLYSLLPYLVVGYTNIDFHPTQLLSTPHKTLPTHSPYTLLPLPNYYTLLT